MTLDKKAIKVQLTSLNHGHECTVDRDLEIIKHKVGERRRLQEEGKKRKSFLKSFQLPAGMDGVGPTRDRKSLSR